MLYSAALQVECCVIHDARATLTPSLSRNIWLAVLIMANIDAADTQKNDTPTAQHVCYGVHGGAIKHPKGAASGRRHISDGS